MKISSAAPADVNTTSNATGIVERIRAELPRFSPAERRVADVVLRDPLDVIHRSVSELAADADTSPATVVRLCASVGLRGYQELKITLASESIPGERRVLGDVAPGDTVADITHKVMDGTARAVETASRAVDTAALERIARLLLGARRVVFGAVGTSAPLALDTAYRFVTVGIDASFAPDVHTQHVTARMLGAGDVFFAISHTGSTFETLATARAATAAGATTVALTSFSRSPLTELADVTVVAGSAETNYRVEAMASRIVHLAVLDALFVVLSQLGPTSESRLALTEDVLIEHRI
ncbi:MurR/RpiR family transcriptional regulator [Curtobacterium sp. VKM Ac-1393]|uniref:MurR/RpiR family transcriptional regulator n=1 Tax=Curtobacterium sp. VKM Ac-1393 TaxID=2783814 RepID=UPI00188ABEAE|nr:MurR/RpiR family transcriptional regulator [Curtobacterium sp. VKM Ac-1393]MBF4607603.1 MurR/RpiR family transcriptional regulator [Curtobacterium sp. VKM Ac-1393]